MEEDYPILLYRELLSGKPFSRGVSPNDIDRRPGRLPSSFFLTAQVLLLFFLWWTFLRGAKWDSVHCRGCCSSFFRSSPSLLGGVETRSLTAREKLLSTRVCIVCSPSFGMQEISISTPGCCLLSRLASHLPFSLLRKGVLFRIKEFFSRRARSPWSGRPFS